jgi:hypothetical protein
MSLYYLLVSQSGINPLPPSPIIRPIPANEINLMAVQGGNTMDPNLKVAPSPNQAFQIVVNGVGAVSASVQIYGSNDKVNWTPIGSPVKASGINSGNNGANGSIGYSFFGALLVAISGTNATVTCTMNA